MNILNKLSDEYRIDSYSVASTIEEIRKLKETSSIVIPEDYLSIIIDKTEIEINISGEKYIRIWGANGCLEMNEAYDIQEYIPNSLAIADDEGGNALIYATGPNGFGLYIIPFNDLEIDELKFISKSLSDLFIYNIGINILINEWLIPKNYRSNYLKTIICEISLIYLQINVLFKVLKHLFSTYFNEFENILNINFIHSQISFLKMVNMVYLLSKK